MAGNAIGPGSGKIPLSAKSNSVAIGNALPNYRRRETSRIQLRSSVRRLTSVTGCVAWCRRGVFPWGESDFVGVSYKKIWMKRISTRQYTDKESGVRLV